MNCGDRCITPDITRSAKNTVAPAKAGAYDVCMGGPTGEIGPSLRWGDEVFVGIVEGLSAVNHSRHPELVSGSYFSTSQNQDLETRIPVTIALSPK